MYGSWDQMYAALAEVSGVPAEDLHARREPRFREMVAEALEPSPELLRLLRELEGRGVKRAIASSSDSDWVAYLLDGLGIRSAFQEIVTGHDVVHRKPAPDLYLLAARRIEADPRRSVALEDSVHGIQAAQAAGMRVIAIPNTVAAMSHPPVSRPLRFNRLHQQITKMEQTISTIVMPQTVTSR